MKSLGIIGTAKNTGKTTTTIALLAGLAEADLSLGLTSIGYDGEDLDNITGLPKPRVHCPAGLTLATAGRCLEKSAAQTDLIEETGIATPLGRVGVARVTAPGPAVLAGPNQGRDVRRLLRRFDQQEIDLALVDGALNRIVPLMETSALILATGAARVADADTVARETGLLLKAFSLPTAASQVSCQKQAALLNEAGSAVELLPVDLGRSRATLAAALATLTAKTRPEAKTLYLPGLFDQKAMSDFIEKSASLAWGRQIVVPSAANVLLSLAGDRLGAFFDLLKGKEITLKVAKSVPALAVTANPFYPRYIRQKDGSYQSAYLDSGQLLESLRAVCSLPVFDLKAQGSGLLLGEVVDFLKS